MQNKIHTETPRSETDQMAKDQGVVPWSCRGNATILGIHSPIFDKILAPALMVSLWQMIPGSISGILVGAYANTSRLSDKNFLNKIFSWGCGLEPIQKTYFGWCGSTRTDLGYSSVLLSGSPNLMGKSGSGSSDSVGELEFWLSSFCNCYWLAILLCSLSIWESSSETTLGVFVI